MVYNLRVNFFDEKCGKNGNKFRYILNDENIKFDNNLFILFL